MGGVSQEKRGQLERLTRRFDTRMRLALASELAIAGRLLEAESLICPGMRLPATEQELDLLARIHVRQGRYSDAKSRWQEAIRAATDGKRYEQCIDELTRWLDYRRKMLRWRLWLALWLLAVLVSVVMLLRVSGMIR